MHPTTSVGSVQLLRFVLLMALETITYHTHSEGSPFMSLKLSYISLHVPIAAQVERTDQSEFATMTSLVELERY